jgi:hypothetical protein
MNEKVIIIFPPDEVDMARKAGEKALAYDCGIDIFQPFEREEMSDGSVKFSQEQGTNALSNIFRKIR